MPTQEAVEVMYEVLAGCRSRCRSRRSTISAAWSSGSASQVEPEDARRRADFEEELRADVVCPDGEVRVLKGTPDVLMFDPPHSLLIIDAKRAAAGRGVRGRAGAGRDRGGAQVPLGPVPGRHVFAAGLRRYPAAQRVTFRECHLRSGQVRQGDAGRASARARRAEAGAADDAAGPMRSRRARTRRCGVRGRGRIAIGSARWRVSCPIPQEMRGDGAIESPEDANAGAEAAGGAGGRAEGADGPVEGVRGGSDASVAAWRMRTRWRRGSRRRGRAGSSACLICAMAGNFPERFKPIRLDLLRKLAKAQRAVEAGR
jgi:hypothetical protein